MDSQKLINDCHQAIGESQPDEDWQTKFSNHPEQLHDTAPELVEILRLDSVARIVREYEEADGKALDAKRRFDSAVGRSIWFVGLVSCFSALLMVPATLALSTDATTTKADKATLQGSDSVQSDAVEDVTANDKSLIVVANMGIGLLALLCGGIATFYIVTLQRGLFLEIWFNERGRAEVRRQDYFRQIVSQVGNVRASLLVLEYVRRYLLDAQIGFYARQERESQNSRTVYVSCVAFCSAGAGVVTGASGFLVTHDPRCAAFSAVAIIMSAVVSVLRQKESINQNSRNTERYIETRAILAELAITQLDDLRCLITSQNPGASARLKEFYQLVSRAMASEHAQWREMSTELKDAIGRLKDNLERSQKRPHRDLLTGDDHPGNDE